MSDALQRARTLLKLGQPCEVLPGPEGGDVPTEPSIAHQTRVGGSVQGDCSEDMYCTSLSALRITTWLAARFGIAKDSYASDSVLVVG